MDDFISSYFNAWNEASTKDILQHLTDDCVQYDHFWHTTVPRNALGNYLTRDFKYSRAHYSLTDSIEISKNKVAYQYNAALEFSKTSGLVKFMGVEVLSLRRGKINRITHLYEFPAEITALYSCPVPPAKLSAFASPQSQQPAGSAHLLGPL